MQRRIDKPLVDQDDGALICPVCRGRDLHHYLIDIFSRSEGDSSTTWTQVSSQGGLDGMDYGSNIECEPPSERTITQRVESDKCGNPSPRRGGLAITFKCEVCDATPRLSLLQHKGTSYFEWADASKLDTQAPGLGCREEIN